MRERKRTEGSGRIKTEKVVIDDQEIEWSTNNNCGQDDTRKGNWRRKSWFGGEKRMTGKKWWRGSTGAARKTQRGEKKKKEIKNIT